jgi:hypothetical protein
LHVVQPMKVRLTRKLADCIDGVDVAPYSVGDLLDLPAGDARLLLAEEWAVPAHPSGERDRAAQPTRVKGPATCAEV